VVFVSNVVHMVYMVYTSNVVHMSDRLGRRCMSNCHLRYCRSFNHRSFKRRSRNR
jgi:hypothetical protein